MKRDSGTYFARASDFGSDSSNLRRHILSSFLKLEMERCLFQSQALIEVNLGINLSDSLQRQAPNCLYKDPFVGPTNDDNDLYLKINLVKENIVPVPKKRRHDVRASLRYTFELNKLQLFI